MPKKVTTKPKAVEAPRALRAMIMHPNGTLEYKNIDWDKLMPELRQIIGGDIEPVLHDFKHDGAPAQLYVREERVRTNLPPNERATALSGGKHAVVGVAVLVSK